MPTASIVIPTRDRPAYLEVALASVCPQAQAADVEVLVVDDAGASAATRALTERFGARYEPHPCALGLNAARNTGVRCSRGELVVFVDDDIRASPGWLEALLGAATEAREVDVFTGPLRARLEGSAPRSCGRERPPITTLDLGDADGDAPHAWGANMAIRRSALERIGPFDVTLEHGGDEQEWQERMRAAHPGARVRYVAAAAVEHRRAGRDTRLRALSATAYARGRAARRYDVRCARAPTLRRELRTLAGCAGHVVRRRCVAGVTMVAHSAGRLREGLAERRGTGGEQRGPGGEQRGTGGEQRAHDADDFLSGTSGTVGGLGALRRRAADDALDALELLSGRRGRLARAARRSPPRRSVLVLSVVREQERELAAAAHAELERSRHRIAVHTRDARERGKFENLNLLLEANPPDLHDWLLVIDDDVALPRGFLDRFLFLCEHFGLVLAQPAHRLCSHAAWPVTRRRPGSIVRETRFVEIGPVTAFARASFPVLLPFPQLRMGWGLDVHWSALALEHGWRCGVVDAVPVGHRASAVGAAYDRRAAIEEARAFLGARPYLNAREAGRTLATHRRW